MLYLLVLQGKGFSHSITRTLHDSFRGDGIGGTGRSALPYWPLTLFPTHFLGEVGIDWGTMAAASAFLMVAALIVVFAMQKAMVRGLIKGAVKG